MKKPSETSFFIYKKVILKFDSSNKFKRIMDENDFKENIDYK